MDLRPDLHSDVEVRCPVRVVKHQYTKTRGTVEVWLNSFLIFALHNSEWPGSRIDRLAHGKECPVLTAWMGVRDRLDIHPVVLATIPSDME